MASNTKRLGRGLSSLFNPTDVGRKDEPEAVADNGNDHEVHTSQDTAEPIIVSPPMAEMRVPLNTPKAAITVIAADVEPSQAVMTQSVVSSRDNHKDHSAPARVESPSTLAIDQIIPNRNQPRQVFSADSIASLAKSIEQSGIVQPLVVRPVTGAGESVGVDQAGAGVQYELIAGERRWRAARAAGFAGVPVIVRELDDREALEVALVENIQREDLNAIDRARAYQGYCREFGVGAEDLAQRLGEDRSTISNYMRLLELPQSVQKVVSSGQLSMGHARCILGLDGDEARIDVARSAVANALSVRAVEEMVRRRKGAPQGERAIRRGVTKVAEKRPYVADLESRMSQALGTKVQIHEGRKRGSGKILIEYYSLDDFDRISERMGLDSE